MIPYGRQDINSADIQAVVDVLRSDWLTQGPVIEKFEDALAEYVGADYAVAFSSATAALHASAWATGLGPSSVGATSPLTFASTANCLRYVGAQIELVDINPESLNIDLEKVPEVDALVPVHFSGLPVDLRNIRSKRPSVVIEDAAHALGARTPEGPVGMGADSDVTCFSFHPVKPITSGEGGMAVTNNSELAERLKIFRSHGIVRKPEKDPWYYEVQELGFHYRMTDIQAALGLSQLARVDGFIAARNEQAAYYRERLVDFPITLPPEAPGGFTHGYHLFPVLVENRRRVFDALHSLGVRVQVHYIPLHRHPLNHDLASGHLNHVDRVYERILSLPIFPALAREDQDFVVDSLEKALER